MKKSSKYHHGNLKEEMLQLALETISKEGIEVLTLKFLSDKLNTSRSAIYRHFSSKQDLIQNVIAYGFNLFEETLIPTLNKNNGTVLERLSAMSDSYLDFAINNPNLYRVLFGEKYQDIRENTCTLADKNIEDSFTLLIMLLEEGKEKDILKIENSFLQAQTIHALIHGIAILYIDGHINIKNNINELYKISFDSLLNGIKKQKN
ncbi:TetR/AcrR family transcriptional regulator [Arcobacter sp. CECT 8983]|uniref:TetR/AcrR family transcriptional regulator n=1 Tax=Arcobacter sp. CECT 8983 TaxID=2044508 RepID=UPI0013E98DAD|nr:TetR/AcrR family transcriptional regulator [Arcobacter sp. CECT 8983]